MASENASSTSTTSDFLDKFAYILNNVDVKTFKWSEDGKYVLIYSKQYEEDLIKHQDLSSIFSGAKDVSELTEFLSIQGFKKMHKRSRKDLVVLKHPQFEKKSPVLRKKASGVKRLTSSDEDRLRSSDCSFHDAHMQLKKRPVRELYQYINLGQQ